MNNRKVILHYHLFKNAGSSVDRILKNSFGEDWVNFDVDYRGSILTTSTINALIENIPNVKAWSSHQIVPPIPSTENVSVYPIIFLRHPIDRAKSAYLFESKGPQTNKLSFEEYIKMRFQSPRKNAIENFQTLRLANSNPNIYFDISKINDDLILKNAQELVSSLKFVGIVDQFDLSTELMKKYLVPNFPSIKIKSVQENALQPTNLTVREKIDKIKSELTSSTFQELKERNQLDIELYWHAKRIFAKRIQDL